MVRSLSESEVLQQLWFNSKDCLVKFKPSSCFRYLYTISNVSYLRKGIYNLYFGRSYDGYLLIPTSATTVWRGISFHVTIWYTWDTVLSSHLISPSAGLWMSSHLYAVLSFQPTFLGSVHSNFTCKQGNSILIIPLLQ